MSRGASRKDPRGNEASDNSSSAPNIGFQYKLGCEQLFSANGGKKQDISSSKLNQTKYVGGAQRLCSPVFATDCQ